MELYKPYIRVKLLSETPSGDEINMYPPVIINKTPDNLEMSCTVKRDALQGNFALTCLLDIVNLNTFVKWQLLSKNYKYMIVYAGYLGTDYYSDIEGLNDTEYENYIESKLKVIFKGYILWMGTIVEARKKVTTRFFSVQNPAESLSAYTEALSVRFNAGYNLYRMIRDISSMYNNANTKMNISAEEYEEVISYDTKSIDNFNRKTIDAVLNSYGITITQGFDMTEGYITKDTYIEMNSRNSAPDEKIRRNVTVVSENTGLIDIPTLQMSGDYPTVRFRMLFNSRIKTFEYVKLNNADIQLPSDISDAKDIPNVANSGIYLDWTVDDTGKSTGWGYYLVLTITYSLDSRGSNFIQELECAPYDKYTEILKGNQ